MTCSAGWVYTEGVQDGCTEGIHSQGPEIQRFLSFLKRVLEFGHFSQNLKRVRNLRTGI